MKLLKFVGITLVSLVLILYLTILFVIPNVVKIDDFKSDIQKIVKEQADLDVDFENARITVTPLLSAGLKADKLIIKLPDNSELFRSDLLIGRISLPQLLFSNIKVTKAEISNPIINIDIIDGNKYKITDWIEKLSETQNKEEKPQSAKPQEETSLSYKLDIPQIKILNYSAIINDLKTNDYLKLRGDELLLGYNDGNSASLKTIAELFVNDSKNITANIDINTFIPNKQSETNGKSVQDNGKNEQIPFINPVAIYKAYNLKTNIDSKIKIKQKNNKIVSKGYLNIDNLTLMLSGVQLPESKLHIKTDDTNIKADTELYISDIEKIAAQAEGDYGKNNSLDLKIKSNEIHVENALKLVKAAIDSANIKNDIDLIKGSGYFIADTEFKTDFKKLNSNGNITLKDIDIKNAKDNTRIAKINSVISLDESILKFVNTSFEVLDTIFNVEGTINQQSYADIKVIMQKMPLAKAFNTFLPKEINSAYSVNSGNINLAADLNGELKALKAKVKLSLSNLSVKDKVNAINYLNNLLTADFESDLKSFKGIINNSDFKVTMNGANVNCDKFSLNVGDKDIIINPAELRINNSTDVNIQGSVKDYLTNPIFDIDLKGLLRTSDLKQLLGKDIAIYIKDKGILPITAKISGDSKKQIITASVSADSNNYITPVDIQQVLNQNTILNTVIELKDNKLTLKDTGFFVKNGTAKTEIVVIDGTISKLNTKSPIINAIKVKIPSEINGVLAIFPKSKMSLKGEAVISGELNNPKIRGDFSAANISIPELLITIEKAFLKFEDKNLDLELKKLIANESDFNIVMSADLASSSIFTIKNLNIISTLLDADKVMKVSDALTKYTTPAASSKNTSSSLQNTVSADIPVVIKDGSIDIKELKSGNITLQETTAKISMAKNVFYLKNLITSAFKGKINGDVSMNLVTSAIKADVKGTGLDVEQTLLDVAAMKDTLTGTMDFDADLSLKGSVYEEQVKTLKGNVNFTMKDGSLGALGKIENLVSADNLSTSSALKALINTAVSSTVDTSKYNTLKGHLSFDKGIAQINPITSSGDYMSTYIFGNFDVLKNTADMKLRGKLASKVTNSMGQLAMLNPVNVVKTSSNMNMVLGSLLLTMCEKVTTDEMAQIPTVTKETSDENTAKFQVVIRGDAAKPLKLVRSFKWLATEAQIKEAKDYLGTLSVISVPKDLKEVKQQAKDILKNLTSEGTNETAKQGKEAVNAVKSLLNSAVSTKSTQETSNDSSDSASTSLKDQLKQLKTNTLKQLAEQAKQAASQPDTTDTNE